MSNISERLDELKKLIQEEDFLNGRGLSNEVNIRIFCYDPKDEITVRYFVEQLEEEKLKCSIDIEDLYEVFLSICGDMDILNSIPDMEETDGNEYLEEQLENIITAEMFTEKIASNYESKDLLFITGVGKVFPFMRVHSLLNDLQINLNNKPVVVLYPGTFDGHYLKLFNKLKPSEYYRAFKTI